MTAMLFSAGLGTRLQPITLNLPKVLVPVNGVPLLEHNILSLKKHGVKRIIINVHYFADAIRAFLNQNNNFGVEIIISDESNQLLDTGGGLKKASHLFKNEEVIIVQNADILTDINYAELLQTHQSAKAMATLAVRNRRSSRMLLFNQNNELIGWENQKEAMFRWCNLPVSSYKQMAFSGVQVISPALFDYFKPESKFSIIDTYLEAGSKNVIKAFEHNHNYWFDIGSVDKLNEAELFFKTNFLVK